MAASAGLAARLFTARRRPTAQPCVRSSRRRLVEAGSTCAGSCGSRARTSSRSKRRSRSRNSASSSWARSRASASGGSVRVERTTPHCGGSRSSSRSRNSNTAGSRIRCASSTTIRPRSTSQAARVLSSSLVTVRRSLRLPPAMATRASGSVRQGGSSGSSAAQRQASRPSGSSPESTATQATAARPASRGIRPVRAAVLPNPAGAASSTSRLVERRLGHALLQRLAANQAGAGTRCLDLGQGERRRGHGGVGTKGIFLPTSAGPADA